MSWAENIPKIQKLIENTNDAEKIKKLEKEIAYCESKLK